MGLKVCKSGSLYETQIRITRMFIVYYSMEESVTLQYGNFAILGEQVREFDWRTGCSNWVADQILRGQLFLDELWREYLGWTTAQKQEWGLFCWNTCYTMWWPCRQKSIESNPKHCKWRQPKQWLQIPLHADPFRAHGFRDLKGCWTSLQGEHVVVPSILSCDRKRGAWGSCTKNLPGA